MDIINTITKNHRELFGNNPIIEKINVGFTNTIYKVNNFYIVKVCTNLENEENFQKEIDFYNLNKTNNLIPKLYYSNTEKKEIPYLYEIIEKIEGVSLYNVWHTYNESEREEIVKEICNAMKQIHSISGKEYDWKNFIKNKFILLYQKVKDLNIFTIEEEKILEKTYNKLDEYLESKEFVLIHNDLHFDNIFIHNGKIKIIDFERSMYAPKDFELDIFYRMIRKPWKYASEETESYTDINQYINIMNYVKKYYPELLAAPNLYIRLGIYDIVYFLSQIVKYPEIKELKNDILSAVNLVLSEETITDNNDLN